jgi:hypothetical protein
MWDLTIPGNGDDDFYIDVIATLYSSATATCRNWMRPERFTAIYLVMCRTAGQPLILSSSNPTCSKASQLDSRACRIWERMRLT